MTILNEAKRQVALLIGGSQTSIPTSYMIGAGSGVTSGNMTTLINAVDRQDFTAVSNAVAYQIQYTGDWAASEVSGLQISEFGITGSAAALTGSMWTRTSIPPVSFDGTNELRIETKLIVT